MNYQYPQFQPMQFQQPQPYGQIATPRPALSGRMVASDAEIVPNDVPTDGSTGYFPARDGSCIYAKAWSNDGTIRTVRYTPEPQPEPAADGPTLAEIAARVDALERASKAKSRKKADDE